MCWTRGKDWNDRNQMIKFFDREDYQLGWNERIEIIYNNKKKFPFNNSYFFIRKIILKKFDLMKKNNIKKKFPISFRHT